MITLYRRPKLGALSYTFDRIALFMAAIIVSITLSIVLSPTY